MLQALSKHNSIKPCLWPELRAVLLEGNSLDTVLLEFQRKLENEDVSPLSLSLCQMIARVELGLEQETNVEMGYANSWEGLVLEDRVLTVQYLNVVMIPCCLSNKMRLTKLHLKRGDGSSCQPEQAAQSSVLS